MLIPPPDLTKQVCAAGSIRDDGPLPDVNTDMARAQDAMPAGATR